MDIGWRSVYQYPIWFLTEIFSDGKIAVLRMGNLQNGRIVLDKLVYTSDSKEIEKYPLEYNDLLFNRTNSKELVGKVAIYKSEIPAIYAGVFSAFAPTFNRQ